MARKTDIRLRRSATAGNAPSTSDLNLGEVALNTTDGALFYKRNDGTSDSVIVAADARTLTIDYTNRRVGVLQSSPVTPLHVTGTIRTQMDGNNSKYINVFGGNSGNFIDSHGNTLFLRPSANTTNSARLDNAGNFMVAGNLGVGTTAPGVKLDVLGGADAIGRITGTTTAARLDLKTDTHHVFMQVIESDGRFRIYDQTAANEYLTISNAGNIGIGTSSPDEKLHVNGNMRVGTTAQGRIKFADSDDTEILGRDQTHGSGACMTFKVNDADRMHINNSGNVGIGTASPATALEVVGNITLPSDGQIKFRGTNHYPRIFASNNDLLINVDDGAGNNFTALMIDNATGNIGIGTTSPTEPLSIHASDPKIKLADTDGTNQVGTIFQAGPMLAFQSRNNTSHGTIKFQGYNGTSGLEFARFNASGNFGIGTGSPSGGKLVVHTSDGYALRLQDNSSHYFRVAHGGATEIAGDVTINAGLRVNNNPLILDTNPAATYGVSEALRIDDSAGTNDRALQIFELLNSGTRSHRIAFNTNITTTGSAYTYTQGNYGGSSQIEFGNSGPIVFYTNPQDTGGSTTAITPIERFRIESDGDVKFEGGNVFYDASQNAFNFIDNVYAQFGTGNDLRLYHTGFDSYIDNANGHLVIRNTDNDRDIVLQSDDGSGGVADYLRLDGSNTNMAVSKTMVFADSVKASFGAAEDLRIVHDGTNSTIDNFQGDLLIRQQVDDKDIVLSTDNGSGGVTEYLRLDGSHSRTTFNKETVHFDNVKANFGTSSDLQIYHDTNNSFILHNNTSGYFKVGAGAASLFLHGNRVDLRSETGNEAMLQAFHNGAVKLYHDAVLKLETTSTGASVTGNLVISGDLTVNGATTTLNVATLDVEDKNITLNKGSGDTSGSADGAGITIQDAVDASNDATFNWNSTNDRWEISHTLNFQDGDPLTWGGNSIVQHTGSKTHIGDNSSGSVLTLQSGKVGIGTTSPTAPVTIKSNSASSQDSGLTIQANGNTNAIFKVGEKSTDGGRLHMFDGGVEKIAFYTDGTANHISSGNVGIGTSSPSKKLHVQNGSSGFSGSYNSRTAAIFEGSASNGTTISIMSPPTGFSAVYFGDDSQEFSGQIAYEHSVNAMKFLVNASEKMRISSAGNVGIGTASPDRSLVVNHASDTRVKLQENGTDVMQLQATSSEARVSALGGSIPLALHTNGAERMRINNSGNVGIGTTSPTTNLEILDSNNSTAVASMMGIRLQNDDQNATSKVGIQLRHQRSTAGSYSFNALYMEQFNMFLDCDEALIVKNNGNQNFIVTGSGRVGIGTTSPLDLLHIKDDSTDARFLLDGHTDSDAEIKFAEAGTVKFTIGNDAATDSFVIGTANVDTQKRFEINSSGVIKFNGAYSFPTSDGSAGQVLKTDGSGNLSFAADSGGGSASSLVDADNDTKIQVEESSDEDVIRMDTGGTERVQVTSNGINVVNSGGYRIAGTEVITSARNLTNVGTYTGSGNLDITSASSPKITLTDTTNGCNLLMYAQNSNSHIGTYTNHLLAFDTNSTTRMVIAASGNVGIGESNPQALLHVTKATGGTTGTTIAAGTDAGILLQDSSSPSANYFVSKIHNPGNGNAVGGIKFAVSPDSANFSWAGMKAFTSASGDADILAFFTSAGNTSGDSSTERMRIDPSGKVGIGTSSPAPQSGASGSLHIHGSSTASEIKLTNSSTGSAATDGTALVTSGSTFTINNREAGAITFGTSNIERARIDSSGRVGIGTTSPQSKLETNLHSGSDSSSMNANSVNDVHLIRAGFGQNAASASNAGAKWGLRFVGRNDSNYDNTKSGAIFGVSEDSSAGYNRKVGLAFHTSSFDASHAERMRINADGHVGIGTTSPSEKLQVNGKIKVSNGGNLFIDSTATDVNFAATGSQLMRFETNSSERLRITNTGNVGIGTSSPVSLLDLGTGSTSGSGLSFGNTLSEIRRGGNSGDTIQTSHWGNVAVIIDSDNNDTSTRAFKVMEGNTDASTANELFRVRSDGNVGIGTSSPSEKLHVLTTGNTVGKFETSLTSDLAIELKNSQGSMFFGLGGGEEFAVGTTSDLNGAGNLFAIKQDGNVGIGTTSPTSLLEVSDTSGDVDFKLRSSNTGSSTIRMGDAGNISAGYIEYDNNVNNYIFATSNTERLRIDSSGRVGIGTTSPGAKLHVNASTTIGWSDLANAHILVGTTSAGIGIDTNEIFCKGSGHLYFGTSSAGGDIKFRSGGTTEAMTISGTNQRVGIAKTTPLARFQVEEYGIDTTTTSTSATTQVAIHTFPIANFRSARFTIQITNSTDSTYHTTELLAVHDGTTANITEFGTIFTGAAIEAQFDADVSSSNFRLLATPSSTDSMVFKVVSHSITV